MTLDKAAAGHPVVATGHQSQTTRDVIACVDQTEHPAVQLLADAISGISEDVYAAGWMQDCEWGLWRALSEWRASRPAVWGQADMSAHMPALDWLHRQAGGWVWWLDGARFVPDRRWLRLAAERERELVSNERLDLRIAASGGEA